MGLFSKSRKKENTIICSGDGFPKKNAEEMKRPCGCRFCIDAGKNLIIFSSTNPDSVNATYSIYSGDSLSPFEVMAAVCPECGAITSLPRTMKFSGVDIAYARINNTVESARGNGVKPE